MYFKLDSKSFQLYQQVEELSASRSLYVRDNDQAQRQSNIEFQARIETFDAPQSVQRNMRLGAELYLTSRIRSFDLPASR